MAIKWRLAKSLEQLRKQIKHVYLNMRPVFSGDDQGDRLLDNSVVSCDCSLGFAIGCALTDRRDVGSRKFAVWVGQSIRRVFLSDSLCRLVSTNLTDSTGIAVWVKLHSRIRFIVRMSVATVRPMLVASVTVLRKRYRLKVVWPHAASIPANVVNLVGIGDGPNPNLVGVSMCDGFPPSTVAKHGKVAVTSSFFTASPKPARISAANVTLKARKFGGRIFFSQDVNLQRQVSFWSGSLGALTPCGPLVF